MRVSFALVGALAGLTAAAASYGTASGSVGNDYQRPPSHRLRRTKGTR